FQPTNREETCRLHLSEPPIAPRTLRPEISPELEQLILRCLAKRREERYETAEQLSEHLRQIGEGLAAAAMPAPVSLVTLPPPAPSPASPPSASMQPCVRVLNVNRQEIGT